jgi:hypothetical protein
MHAIHNARVQLLASALNNLGVRAIIAGIVAPGCSGSTAFVSSQFSGAARLSCVSGAA